MLEYIRNLVAQVPRELTEHPTIAKGLGEFIEDRINAELQQMGLPYSVDIQYNGQQ
jgi:hypothetical protein